MTYDRVRFMWANENNVLEEEFTFSLPVKYSKNIRPEIMSDNIPYFENPLVFNLQCGGITYDLTGICTVDEKEKLEVIINHPETYDGNLFLQIDYFESPSDNCVWFDTFEFFPLEGSNKFNYHLVLVVGEGMITDNFNVIITRIIKT